MIDLNILRLRQAYREGTATPADVVRQVIERAQAYSDHNIWITAPDMALIERTPPCSSREGPRGPSGVIAAGCPLRSSRTIALAALAPPFEEEPRTEMLPQSSIPRAMITPWMSMPPRRSTTAQARGTR